MADWAENTDYFIRLPPQRVKDIINQEEDISKRRAKEKLIKIGTATTKWGKDQYEKIAKILGPNAIETKKTWKMTTDANKKITNRLHGSFATWLLELAEKLNTIGEFYDMPDELAYDLDKSFLNLEYDLNADSSTINSKNSYILQGKWLISQITVALNQRLKNPTGFEKPKFIIGRASRRENPDSTHLRCFTQLEMRHYIKNPKIQDLQEWMTTIFSMMGLVPDKITYRPTINTFTAPSIEAYYEHQGEQIEIANGGLFLPKLYDSQNIPIPAGHQPIGFGGGLERIYMIQSGVKSIKEV